MAAAVTVTSIAVSPTSPSITAGATQQFTATATYSNGTTGALTSGVTWTSSITAAATVSATGLATSVAAGTATIKATADGFTATAMLTVTAAAVTVTSIAVSPTSPSITAGATQQFTATATYSTGTTGALTAGVTWTSSSNTAAATVRSTGLATGVAAGTTTIKAAADGFTATAKLTVTAATAPTLTAIAVTPSDPTFANGSTQQFTATATYSNNTTANVTSSVTWSSSNTPVATISSGGLATAQGGGTTTISAAMSSVKGNTTATVTVSGTTNITTFHVDTNRSGLNDQETVLTTANVAPATFGKLSSCPLDGYVYGAPLVLTNQTIGGAKHNVLYVATENDSVYAYDADTCGGGTPLWKVSLLQSGESALADEAILPYVGVTSTPVIDPTSGTLYVVSTEESSSAGGTFRLSALNVDTGAQKFGGPVTITASVAATNTDSVNGRCRRSIHRASSAPLCCWPMAMCTSASAVAIADGYFIWKATTAAQVGVFVPARI